MSRITITLHIDIPENARVATPDVDYASEPTEPEYVAPLPPQALYDAAEMVKPVAGAPTCPKGHGAMTRYPAGVSKKPPYKPYNASWRCDMKDCDTRPIWDKDVA